MGAQNWKKLGPEEWSERWSPERVGARKVGAQSLGFRGILVVFEALPGFHTTTREPKRAHLRARFSKKNTTKIQREDIQRGEKRTNSVTGEGKKSDILGGPGVGRAVLGKAWDGRGEGRGVHGEGGGGPEEGGGGPGEGRGGPGEGEGGPGEGGRGPGKV